jgi:hypothetical protein
VPASAATACAALVSFAGGGPMAPSRDAVIRFPRAAISCRAQIDGEAAGRREPNSTESGPGSRPAGRRWTGDLPPARAVPVRLGRPLRGRSIGVVGLGAGVWRAARPAYPAGGSGCRDDAQFRTGSRVHHSHHASTP